MITAKWIDPKVSIGNIITLIVLAFGISISYVQMQDTVLSLKAEQQMITRIRDEQIRKLETKDIAIELDIRSIRDQAVARQEAIVSRLSRIEAILERIDKNSLIERR